MPFSSLIKLLPAHKHTNSSHGSSSHQLISPVPQLPRQSIRRRKRSPAASSTAHKQGHSALLLLLRHHPRSLTADGSCRDPTAMAPCTAAIGLLALLCIHGEHEHLLNEWAP